MARAVRPDKTILAALAATLGLYRAGRATSEIPIWRMIIASIETLGRRAEAIRAALPRIARDRVEVHEMESTIGGGSLPGERLASIGLAIAGRGPRPCRRGFEWRASRRRPGERRRGPARLRTVDPADDPALAGALAPALAPR